MNRQQRRHMSQYRAHERNRRIQFNQDIGKHLQNPARQQSLLQESPQFEQPEIEFYTDREETVLT